MTIGYIDNTYSDAAISNILANHRYVRFMPGDYIRTTAISGFSNGQKIEARGARFCAGSDEATLINLSGLSDVSIDEIHMEGTRAGNGAVNTQHGLIISDCRSLHIGSIIGKNFKGRAVMMPLYTGAYARRARNHFNNLSLHGNLMGLDIGGNSANEYSVFTSINATGNQQAFLCAAANVIFNGGCISDNVNGGEWVGMVPNHAHGICSNVQFNHNSGFSAKFSDIVFGQTLSACHFYADSESEGQIILLNSRQINITGGTIAANIVVNAGDSTRHGKSYIKNANTDDELFGVTGAQANDLVVSLNSLPVNPGEMPTSGGSAQLVHAARATNNQPIPGAQTTLVFNGATLNVGDCYDTSTGEFTAPEAGNYLFVTSVTLVGTTISGAAFLTYLKKATGGSWATESYAGLPLVNNNLVGGIGSTIIPLAAGEKLKVAATLCFGATNVVLGANSTNTFKVFRL